MADRKKLMANRDNEGLGAWGTEHAVVGYVEEVNGRASREVPDFVPTRHELLLLVKQWEGVALDIEFYWSLWAQISGKGSRKHTFARRRINRIARALGDDVVRRGIDEVWEAFGKKVDPRAWEIFLQNHRKQIDAFQNEFQELVEDDLTIAQEIGHEVQDGRSVMRSRR
jgi:hypothetical protein